MKHFFMLLGLLIASIHTATANYVYTNPTGNEMPIMAWYSIIGDDQLTLERYQELRDAGFNISFSHFGALYQVQKALELGQQTNVKIMAMCNELTNDPQGTATLLKTNPALAGYFIGDEPSMPAFPTYAAQCQAIRQADDQHIIYGNLLPIFASATQLGTDNYTTYVQEYADQIHSGLLSYDMYPIKTTTKGVAVTASYYENVKIVSEISRATNQPFWAFALSTAHNSYPVPTIQQMRLQMFVNLLHGAQGLQYFTYYTPMGTIWDFHNAPIDENGERTDVYYLVQALNAEIQNVAWVFLGSKVENVGYASGIIPQGCTSMTQRPEQIKSLYMSSGNSVLMSHLTQGERHFFVVMNHELNTTQKFTINTLEGVKKLLPTGEIVAKTGREKIELAPSEYIIYMWGENTDAIQSATVQDAFGVSAGNGCIQIHGGMEASVYTLDGRFIGRSASTLPVPKGIYIVRCAGKSLKVIV